MLWWRVTVDKKTGALRSVEQTAERGKDGEFICYVEAASKAGACTAAKAWYVRKTAKEVAYRAARTAERRESGLCTGCGKNPGPGLCEGCREYQRERRLRPAKEPRHPLTPWQVRENKRVARRAINKYYVDIRNMLATFDSLGAAEFRAWLVQQIEERTSDANEVRASMQVGKPQGPVGRPRTGSLIMTKTGWAARVTAQRHGQTVRVQRQLDTTSRQLAERRLEALLRGESWQPMAEAAE